MPTADSGGESAFATTIKEGRWPSPEVFDPVATAYEQQAATLRTAANTSWAVHRPRLAQALQGQAGDAQIRAHDANINLWDTHAYLYERSANAVRNAAAELRSLQNDLRLLIEDKEPQYNSAIRRNEPIAAQGILTATLTEADGMTATRGDAAAKYIHGVNFTAPPPQAPANPDGQGNQDHKDDTPHHDKQTDPDADGKKDGKKLAAGATGSDQTPRRDVQSDLPPDLPSEATAASGPPRDVQTDLPPDALANGSQPLPVSGTGRMPALSPTQMGAGGGGGGASGISGLGSGLKPPSGLASSMPTSPASSLPSAPAASAGSAPAAMSNAGSSFQSGLASGMSATGGGNALSNLGSPVSQQSVTQQGLPAQQVGGAPAFGSGSAGVPLAGPGGDAGVGGAPGGSSSGGAPSGGGAPLMPPAAMGGAAPLAPYSAPGAGAGGAPAGGGAGTAPTASGQPSSSGSPGGPTPGPLVAGGAGSSVSAPGVAALGEEVNPDLLLAQRVLGGLVRGCERWPAPIAWAVSVVKTPVGSQVLVASSLGGGSYLPATVFLPATARLAVVDPALPFGWAHGWMGCQKPSKILADHFEHFRKRVAGASISAMVTTELRPDRPAGVADFAGFQHIDALYLVPAAPSLDGAHQHRLTALDPVLAQRISSIDSIDGHVSAYAAAQLTAAVLQAAGQPDDTGKPLATVREGNILASVQRGTANDMSWKLYDDLLCREYGDDHQSPDSRAPRDCDGSDLYHQSVVWYRHFYHVGRVVELVRLWRGRCGPPLAEIAYCGVQAGFGSVVAAMVSAIEQQIQQFRGRTA